MISRTNLIASLWKGRDPFAGFPQGLYPDNTSELGHGPHPYLLEAIDSTQAHFVVEIGVWKGASAIAMAKHMKSLGIVDGVIVAIDTWLGSSEHWFDSWGDSLNYEFGQPMLMRTFMNNSILSGVSDILLPMALDSINAYEVFKRAGLSDIDVIHVDAGHDYRSVTSDLEAWWPRVRPGGWLVGDDYLDTGDWPEVKQAFDDFFSRLGLYPFPYYSNKCKIQKPIQLLDK